MSDLHLLSLIILRLEKARFTRQAEVRLINQHIQRFEEVRDQRAQQVRQRLLRTTTYNRTQADLNGNAPIFQQEDFSDSSSENSEATSETRSNSDIPELSTHAEAAASEQDFIEARGFIDVIDVARLERNLLRRRINRRTQQQPRLSLANTRARDIREPLHRPRDLDRERDVRLARLTATADAIVLDLLRDIISNLSTIRHRVNGASDE